ncbi:MAG TPA: M55 family metallopeptidase [Verrucomicrobiae bacterium]|nr:M55 family metallopeptidase [Verrucomicrobiae bacterium]
MKLYLSCDMEGTAGVCAWEQCDARTPHPEYALYRTWMMREVRAAIDGAREAGATDVLVNDSHGPMRNVIFEELPDDVRVVSGNRKPFSMVQNADAGFGGAFFTGYHGAIGDADAVLCHTYSPGVIYQARLNDMPCSEATLNAALLGHFGVPLLLITGDRTTVESAQGQMPWVTGAIVKESIGNFASDSISPLASQALIRDAARAAIANRANAKPFVLKAPLTLEIDVARVEQADLIEMIPGFSRVGSRTVRLVHDDYPTVFKAFVAAFRMGGLA